MKICSTSLTEEMQIKIIARFYITPTSMANIKQDNNNNWEGCGEIGTPPCKRAL
jgi:hypothetical protein